MPYGSSVGYLLTVPKNVEKIFPEKLVPYKLQCNKFSMRRKLCTEYVRLCGLLIEFECKSVRNAWLSNLASSVAYDSTVYNI